MKLLFTPLFILIFSLSAQAQMFDLKSDFSRQDTLKGAITQEREWWDLNYYHLFVEVDIEDKFFKGDNLVKYTVIEPFQVMQIDMQEPMKITKVEQDGVSLNFEREGSAYFILLEKTQTPGVVEQLTIQFEGNPKVAIRAPWDGGITWTQDENGNPFVASANQGIGASVWWPNKDHMYDEPDSMRISVNVIENLTNVSNGRLEGVEEKSNGTKTWHWYVSNPINNYGVNINIGDYVHFGEKFAGEKGELDLDYYVLSYNLEKAKKQFKDAPRTIEAFEHWFGPYPFYEDSFKLVEVPYLGMEHQSSVTYGNGYQNGYLGRDLSGSGWGMEFDFIIVHETGHEWFANSITYADAADMWVHEGFTNYSESLFLEYHYGKEAGEDYVIGLRTSIQNDRPILGIYGVDYRGSSDMYYKGANLLHTLRQLFDDDKLWREALRGLNEEFYHQTVSSKQIEDYLSEISGKDLTAYFNQYVRDIRIPVLEYYFRDGIFYYRWGNIVNDFDMPIKVKLTENEEWIFPTNRWKNMKSESTEISINRNFYVGSQNILGIPMEIKSAN